jgi:hypothetical protein
LPGGRELIPDKRRNPASDKVANLTRYRLLVAEPEANEQRSFTRSPIRLYMVQTIAAMFQMLPMRSLQMQFHSFGWFSVKQCRTRSHRAQREMGQPTHGLAMVGHLKYFKFRQWIQYIAC